MIPPTASGSDSFSSDRPPSGDSPDDGAAPLASPPSGSRVVGLAPPDNPDPLVGSTLGKYQIERELGRGAMGVVYSALDTLLKRPVAVKVLPQTVASDPDAVHRFQREGRAAGQFYHPNTVAVFDVGYHEGRHYMVMELVVGGSAADFLTRRGPMNWPEATRVLREVCQGVVAAHAAGLVHRDIKPANIMRSQTGHVKLADFGLAKCASGTPSVTASMTAAGTLVGTPQFMSPEQCQGQPADARSDIYSLGATYYALLTGSSPFERTGGVLQVMFAHVTAPIPDPRAVRPEIPAPCVAVIQRAMAKFPQQRYPSAAAMLADLERILSGETLSADGQQEALAESDEWSALVAASGSRGLTGNARPRASSASGVFSASSGFPSAAPVLGTRPTFAARADASRADGTRGDSKRAGSPTTPLLVLGGVGSVLFVVGLLALLLGGSDVDDPGSSDRERFAKSSVRARAGSEPGNNEPGNNEPSAKMEPTTKAEPTRKTDSVNSSNLSAKPALVPFAAEAAREFQRAWSAKLRQPVQLINSVGMKLALIPPGEFPASPPAHIVVLTRPYYLGVHEVTQEQYTAVMGQNPAEFHAGNGGGSRHPVEQVFFQDAEEFCRRLSARPGEQSAGRVYRLPTEAEWVFAARAGSDSDFHYGATPDVKQMACESREGQHSQPVGKYPANKFGLFDVHGNVSEWVADDAREFRVGRVTDPRGSVGSSYRLIMGGSWGFPSADCAVTVRNFCMPIVSMAGHDRFRDGATGFRVLCEIPLGKA